LLCKGITANPLPPADARSQSAAGPPRRGRRKQPPVRNLLDRLFPHKEEVLAFLDNFRVPFDNNQAERDLRMRTVQQQISGGFRSTAGAEAFCRIWSVLATCAKQGVALLAVLHTLLEGHTLAPSPTT